MEYSALILGVPLKVTLDTEPALAQFDLLAPVQEDECFEWRSEVIPLDQDSQLIKWRLRRRDGKPFKVLGFKVAAAVPVLDIHRIFVPVLHGGVGKLDLISLPWSVQERTFPSWSFPLIAALNRHDENRFCLGLMDQVHGAQAFYTGYDKAADLGLRRLFDELPLETSLWEEILYVSRVQRHVLDEVRAFSRVYDAVNKPALYPAPPAAWAPVWCTWYGINNEVHADYIRRMLPLLQEWGFGSVIVDAGWFRAEGFDVQTGHYHPDERKFPDLGGLIREVQARGLRLLLWCAPLFNLGGIRAWDHPFIREHLVETEGIPPESSVLCPRCRPVREYVVRMVAHLLRTWGADGLKIDFIDAYDGLATHPCTAAHEHDIPDYGEAIHALLKDIAETARLVRPDVLLEFRMNYSNLATRGFATSHRAQDAPFDFDHIRRMCTRLKSYIIDAPAGQAGNAAVHTDPAYWLPQESAQNVACFMASLVTSAVPMLSMDLRALPPEHQAIVRAWLGFFRDHQELLLFGRQRLLSVDPHFSVFSLHREEEALWGVFASPFPGELEAPATGMRRLWLLNGSSRAQVFTRVSGLEGRQVALAVYNRCLEQVHLERWSVENARLILDVEVEIGGAVELRVEV